jgi:maltose/moltooligosaccharide transporter
VAGGGDGAIPLTVKLSFYVGAAAFFGAVLYTILTTPEHPPADMAAFKTQQAANRGAASLVREVFQAIREMPQTMRQLALVQTFTWLGLFCMWLYFGVAVATGVFGADGPSDPRYQQGIEWAGVCFGAYSLVTFLFAFLLPPLAARIGRKGTHALCLSAGAAGLLSVQFITEPTYLLVSMLGVGIAWASILSMPYAILAGSIPEGKTGIYMGIFNFFIVIPEIVAAVGFGWVMSALLGNDRMAAVTTGGVCLIIAALLVVGVTDRADA